jgi:hypothetical protein
LLPGKKIIPERIRENRQPYYNALGLADKAWEQGDYDLSEMSSYLSDLLKLQLSGA